jgi:hypothetical protein
MPRDLNASLSQLKEAKRLRNLDVRKRDRLLFKCLLLGAVLVPLFYLWSLLPERLPPASPPHGEPRLHIDRQRYDQIDSMMTRAQVCEILGGKGEEVFGPDWAKNVGRRAQDVWWERWSDPLAPDRWIAVAWRDDVDHLGPEPRVLEKRKNGF